MKHVAIIPGLTALETAARYCDMKPAEVQGITDQSLQVVEHYAKQVNKRKMAGRAMKKWDAV